LSIFGIKHVPFWIGREWASSVNNVIIPIWLGHKHSVDINLLKKRERSRNSRGNVNIACGSCLAFVICLNEPMDVLFELRPPKVFQKSNANCEDTLVTHFIMCLTDKLVSMILGHY
jgi:hypothetical protein